MYEVRLYSTIHFAKRKAPVALNVSLQQKLDREYTVRVSDRSRLIGIDIATLRACTLQLEKKTNKK